MSLKTILNKETDFTGEFPVELAKDGLWRFNDAAPDADTCLADSSGNERKAYINKWSGTTASLTDGIFGTYFRMNINNPSSEQTYLRVSNDGSIFSNIGDRIIVGGWMRPTTYTGIGVFTIMEVKSGKGSTAGWGRLKSGAGWISLDYAARI